MTRMPVFATLAALAFMGVALPAASAEGWCAWNPRFTDPIEQTFPILHFHDGPVCTVHLHPENPPIGGPENCAWNPSFADAVYTATNGIVHLHGGPICYAHVHL